MFKNDFVCAIVLLICRTKMSTRLSVLPAHCFCYGGGYFWVRGLGAAQRVDDVKVCFTLDGMGLFTKKKQKNLSDCFGFLFYAFIYFWCLSATSVYRT